MRISDWSSDVCSSELFDAIQCFPPRKVCRARHTVNAAPYRIPAPMPDKPSTGGAFSPTVARLLLAAVIILWGANWPVRSEEHTSELQSLMRISYAVFCLKKKNKYKVQKTLTNT